MSTGQQGVMPKESNASTIENIRVGPRFEPAYYEGWWNVMCCVFLQTKARLRHVSLSFFALHSWETGLEEMRSSRNG